MTWNPDDWLKIPHELQRRSQWMVCQGIVNKQPLTLSGYPGDPTDSNNWSSFADACVVAAAHPGWYPGFCTSRSDPISIIDLDNKVHSEELKERNIAIARQFNTAMETSMSGWGLHLFVYGNIGNHIGQHVEIWSENHFVALTGLMHQNNAPILNDPELLDSFASSHLFPQHNSVESDSTDGPEVEDDVAVCQRIMQSHYANTFRTLVTDSWQQEYPDRSNADYAFACILAEYTPSNQQIWRIFNQTTLGQRYKDGKPRHKDSDLFLSNACAKARAKANAKLAENAMLQNAVNGFANGYANGHMDSRADIGRPAAAPAGSNILQFPNPFRQQYKQFEFFGVDELLSRPPVKWVVKNMLQCGKTAILYGWSGVGKTFLVLDMIEAIATGRRWFEMSTTTLPVRYFSLEGVQGLQQRILAWEKLNQRKYPRPPQVEFSENDLDIVQDKEALAIALKDFNGVIIVDTLAQAMGGRSENKSEDMQPVTDAAKYLAVHTNSAVIVVHHSTKPDAKTGETSGFPRGWGGLFANFDADIEIRYAGAETEFERELYAEKVRDGVSKWTRKFTLIPEVLGIDENREQITSLVVRFDAEHELPVDENAQPVEKRSRGNRGGRGRRESAPMNGAKTGTGYSTSINERKLRDGWKGLVKQWGEWVPIGAIEEYMLKVIMGTTKSNKMTSLNRTLTKLEGNEQLIQKLDDKGQQLYKLV